MNTAERARKRSNSPPKGAAKRATTSPAHGGDGSAGHGTQVKVLMVKDVKSGQWKRLDEYSDGVVPQGGGSHSASSSPRRSALTTRGNSATTLPQSRIKGPTWGIGDRASNNALGPNHLPPIQASEADKHIFSSFTRTHASAAQARGGGGAPRHESPSRRQHIEKQTLVAAARFVAPPSHSKPKTAPGGGPRQQQKLLRQQQQRVTTKVVGMLDDFETKKDIHFRGFSVLDTGRSVGGLEAKGEPTFDTGVRNASMVAGGRSTAGQGTHQPPDTVASRSPTPTSALGGAAPSAKAPPTIQSSSQAALNFRRGKPVHPLVGYLCNQRPPQVVKAYRLFCQCHSMPTAAGIGPASHGPLQHLNSGNLAVHGSGPLFEGGSGDILQYGGEGAPPGSPLCLSNSFASQGTADLVRKMETGYYFYVHPDGLTCQQFRQFLPHLAQEVGGVEIGHDFATSMFRAMCPNSSNRLPFSDILKMVTEHLLPAEIHKNIDFILKAFDPHGTQRVPNHMFTSRFFRKFLDQTPSPIPSGSLPQWLLLLGALEGLENPKPNLSDGPGLAASLRSTAGRNGSLPLGVASVRSSPRNGKGINPNTLLAPAPSAHAGLKGFEVDEDEAAHFSWLKAVYLNPHNNYKTFTEKMSLLLSTMRAKQVQRQTANASGQDFGVPMTGGDVSGSGLGVSEQGGSGGGITTLQEVKKKLPTIALTYQEAAVVFWGTPSLFSLVEKNNFIFYPEEATGGAGAQSKIAKTAEAIRAPVGRKSVAPMAEHHHQAGGSEELPPPGIDVN